MFKDLTGTRNNLLKVTNTYRTDDITYVDCLCDCGNSRTLRAQVFKRASTKSCGCLNKASGNVNSPTYHTWVGMKQRCTNPNHAAYENYGGRGISVCARWENFQNFFEDMGEKPVGKELDRENNDLPYEPSNCRWVDKIDNIMNRRCTRYLEVNGITKTWVEWANEAGITRGALKQRLNRGWSPAEAVNLQPRS